MFSTRRVCKSAILGLVAASFLGSMPALGRSDSAPRDELVRSKVHAGFKTLTTAVTRFVLANPGVLPASKADVVPAFGFDAPDPENWVIVPAPEGNAVLICMLIAGSGNANDAIAFQASRLFGASLARGSLCQQSTPYVLVSAVPLPSGPLQPDEEGPDDVASDVDGEAPGQSGNAPGKSGTAPGKGSPWKKPGHPGRGGGLKLGQ